jgi:hypothetical protein
MNLICPHCQKVLAIAEANAGQPIRCPECKEIFSVPALAPASVPLELPEHIGLSPAEETATQRALEGEDDHHSVYTLAPEPSRPAPPRLPPEPKRPERSSASSAPSAKMPTPKAPPKPPKPPVPAGYEHEFVFGINHLVVPWIAPISLGLVFFLWFCGWVAIAPGGYTVYSQNPFQAFVGSFSTDPVGEKVLHMEEQLDKDISANWFLVPLQFFLLLVALALAAVPLVSRRDVFLPPSLQPFLTWRPQILAGACMLLFLMLLVQENAGFGLENAVVVPIDQSVEKGVKSPQSSEDVQQMRIRRGEALGRLGVRHTVWLSLVATLELVATGGALLELCLLRRGPKPLPLVQVHW